MLPQRIDTGPVLVTETFATGVTDSVADAGVALLPALVESAFAPMVLT